MNDRPASHSDPEIIFCSVCGQKNDENNFKCTRCGAELHAPDKPNAAVPDSTLSGLIPHKNGYALWAYYLAIFSLVPCIGSPLGIMAAVMGFKGLKFCEEQPDARGKIHAWVGVILGGICGLVYTLLIVFPSFMIWFD